MPTCTERPALLPTPATATLATPPLRVLVVEDNPDAAESLRLLLEMLGHEVVVADTGIEGVEMALDWEPDVVLSDIGLPGLDGFGVAEELRPTGVRLIALTGYGSEDFRRRAYASGFEEVLIKPADPNVLVRLLAGAVIRRAVPKAIPATDDLRAVAADRGRPVKDQPLNPSGSGP